MNNEQDLEQENAALRAQLQRAMKGVDAPPYLAARIRANIAQPQRSYGWLPKLSAVAAMLMACVGLGVAYHLGHLRFSAASQNEYIASVSNSIPTLMRIGLGDHLHCSYFRKFRTEVPAVEELAKEMGPSHEELVRIVRKHIPAEFNLMLAHECRFHGRRFIHLSLKNDSQLMSLVIAAKKDGESFDTEGLMPELAHSGIPIYRTGVQRFEMASFESRDHLVYFISDFSKEQNLSLMAAMSSEVKSFLNAKTL